VTAMEECLRENIQEEWPDLLLTDFHLGDLRLIAGETTMSHCWSRKVNKPELLQCYRNCCTLPLNVWMTTLLIQCRCIWNVSCCCGL